MKVLHSNGKLHGLKEVDHSLCEGCVFGKQKRVSFSKAGREPRTKKLELIHTDVWGHSTVTSLGGSNYYVPFIDDSSRNVWVYFLKHKFDVLIGAFKTWKVMVETETDLKAKTLQSNNREEYMNVEFQRYCDDNDIKIRRMV